MKLFSAARRALTERLSLFVLIFAGIFTPLITSADSGFSARDEAASFVGDAGGQFERRLRDEVLFGESSLDFSEWLKLRGAVGFDRVVTQRLVSGGVDYVEGLGFVRDVEVRYESPLGQRAGNFGFGALGSLRESADDVVVWELRGFVGEDDVAGANVGAAYRRLVSDNFLAGVNLFLDYERGGGTRADDVADESFWRWSAGVEATGRYLDFSANRYWALSDAVMATVGGEVFRVYSADGWDAELRGRLPLRYPVAFRFLDSAEVAARYYVWESDDDGTGGGDADVSGARYRLGFVPLPQFRFGVEYDDGDGVGKNFGYYVNFRHRLGSVSESVLRDDGGDVWSRRFDPVRREHQQHIMRTQAGAGVVTSVEIFLSSVTANMAVLTLSSYFPAVANYSYAVVSANPPGWTNSVSVDTNTGVVTDSGAKNASSGGTVYFSVSDSAGGVSLEFTVFFRDLSAAVANADADGVVRLFLSALSANAVLLTVMASGDAARTIAVASAMPAAWKDLLVINQVNGAVTDNGLVSDGRSGVVVFSVTDATDAMVLLTVRFGDLSFAGAVVTLTSDDEDAAVLTLIASGGAGGYGYALVSTNPANALLSVNGDALVDAGLAAGGAATVSAFIEASDADKFKATATVTVAVLADVSLVADDLTITITPGDEDGDVLTLTATGGDGDYTYSLVLANPSAFNTSLMIDSDGVISDNGTATEGALTVTAVFSATDGIGEMTVSATVEVVVLDVVGLVADNWTLTLTPADVGAMLVTLEAMGGGMPYIYATASSDPPGYGGLAIDSNGVVSDSTAAAGGAAMATVVFSVTDSGGNSDLATVHLVVFDGVGFVADDVTVTVNSTDAGDNIQTITAMGGDGNYIYALDSINPASFSDSLAINNIGGEGVIADSGAATQGPLTVSAVYSATDGLGDVAMASVEVVVLADVGFVADDLTITVASTDSSAMVLTLTATGGDSSYTYAAASADPSGWENSLAIGNSNGIITDSGAAANRAATASVVFTATDGSGLVASASVEVIAVADVGFSADDISLALTFADAGAEVLTLTASGGIAPYTYAIVSANPAAWSNLVSLSNNGVITEAGVVTVGGSATIAFSVTDSNGMVANATVAFSYAFSKFTGRNQHAAVVFNNRIYVIGGLLDGSTALNDVWSSADGLNWIQETANAGFSIRNGHSALVANGKMYVIGGGDLALNRFNDVWSSTDGTNWTRETATADFPGRIFHSAAVLSNTIYVTGGQNSSFLFTNDVWQSTDGINWTSAASAAGFAVRGSAPMLAANGTLFVIGGGTFSDRYNDVWSSTDGTAWTEETSAAAFSARTAHSAVVLGSEMFVIGGNDGANKNDVYSSTDGASWTQETASAAFSARQGLASVIFNNRIYVIGGFDGSNRLNDVWSSADGINWTQH